MQLGRSEFSVAAGRAGGYPGMAGIASTVRAVDGAIHLKKTTCSARGEWLGELLAQTQHARVDGIGWGFPTRGLGNCTLPMDKFI